MTVALYTISFFYATSCTYSLYHNQSPLQRGGVVWGKVAHFCHSVQRGLGAGLRWVDDCEALTEIPHTGCERFIGRFGLDALKFVSTPLAKQLHNAKIVRLGVIRAGDIVTKL